MKLQIRSLSLEELKQEECLLSRIVLEIWDIELVSPTDGSSHSLIEKKKKEYSERLHWLMSCIACYHYDEIQYYELKDFVEEYSLLKVKTGHRAFDFLFNIFGYKYTMMCLRYYLLHII